MSNKFDNLINALEVASENMNTDERDMALIKVLLVLLKKHKEELADSFENIDTVVRYIIQFRQTDMTESGEDDMMMWQLMNGSGVIRSYIRDVINNNWTVAAW